MRAAGNMGAASSPPEAGKKQKLAIRPDPPDARRGEHGSGFFPAGGGEETKALQFGRSRRMRTAGTGTEQKTGE